MPKRSKRQRLPYIDFLLSELDKQNSAVEKSFGRHVHWGYWETPAEARGTDEDYGRAAENLTLELCRMAGIAEGEKILDVGCGFGGTIASLNERFDKLDMTGLNIDARQLARARQIVEPRAGNKVTFVQGDACDLGAFREGSFDRVLAVECIFHFPSRETFFREAWRVLRPGGMLALSDFIPAALMLPLMRREMPASLEKYNLFGRYKLDHTIGRYRQMAKETRFDQLEERNVTLNILPTYRYLRNLIGRNAAGRKTGLVDIALGLQNPIGRLGLLNYYLLSFRKPLNS